MKLVYTDVFLVILDYFMILERHEFVYEWGIPAAVVGGGISVHYFSGPYVTKCFLDQFIPAIINLFAILVGFTIATVTVFATADRAKNGFLAKVSDRYIGNTRITWYRYFYANLIHAIIAGIVILAASLTGLLLTEKTAGWRLVVFLVLVFGSAHVLLLTVRNVTNLYYAFFEA